jgi:hypothetical protein
MKNKITRKKLRNLRNEVVKKIIQSLQEKPGDWIIKILTYGNSLDVYLIHKDIRIEILLNEGFTKYNNLKFRYIKYENVHIGKPTRKERKAIAKIATKLYRECKNEEDCKQILKQNENLTKAIQQIGEKLGVIDD